MDNAVRRLEGKRTSLGRRKKARGSTNAHSGKASDLSGTTLGPLATSFLRRKVATQLLLAFRIEGEVRHTANIKKYALPGIHTS
jgi:hypothetical protein